jgi:coproporphyrinogen III oxidase
MRRIPAESKPAAAALAMLESLQACFVRGLEEWGGRPFDRSEWLRDDGRHGGGVRYFIAETDRLGRASVNISQVHYDDEPDRRLGSASALSAIVHPAHPHAPSIHIHVSWTEMKSGAGSWRIMADLNPALPDPDQTAAFRKRIKQAAPTEFDEAEKRGARYFFIPVLGRHRGAAHFYLEDYHSGNPSADSVLAQRVGEGAIEGYLDILQTPRPPATDADRSAQLAYHSLYFFQVLTLDRGTTAGLLVHDQNDIGVLGSLPPKIDRQLLLSWLPRMPAPQDRLLDGIAAVLPGQPICVIDDAVKQRLADLLRRHYREHPEALDLQASGKSGSLTSGDHPA